MAVPSRWVQLYVYTWYFRQFRCNCLVSLFSCNSFGKMMGFASDCEANVNRAIVRNQERGTSFRDLARIIMGDRHKRIAKVSIMLLMVRNCWGIFFFCLRDFLGLRLKTFFFLCVKARKGVDPLNWNVWNVECLQPSPLKDFGGMTQSEKQIDKIYGRFSLFIHRQNGAWEL